MKNYTFAHSNIFICCDERFLLFFVQYMWRAQRFVCGEWILIDSFANKYWNISTSANCIAVRLLFLFRLHFDGEDEFFFCLRVSLSLSSNFVYKKSHWIPFWELAHSMFWFSIYISVFFFACLLATCSHSRFQFNLNLRKKHSIHGFLLGVNHVKWLFNNSIISAHWIGVKLLCRKRKNRQGKLSDSSHRRCFT